MDNSSRRDLLKLAALASLGAGLARSQPAGQEHGRTCTFEPKETVRHRRDRHRRARQLADRQLLRRAGRADHRALRHGEGQGAQRRRPSSTGRARRRSRSRSFTPSDHAFEELVKRDDVDLVVIATPWIWHVPMAVAAHEAGQARRHRSARGAHHRGVLGAGEHQRGHAAPLHPARELLLRLQRNDGAQHGARRPVRRTDPRRRAPTTTTCAAILFSNEGEGLWRRAEHLNRDGNLYPTHGLGPVAHYMDVNRGDRFDTLVSMSSISAGLQAYRKDEARRRTIRARRKSTRKAISTSA